VNCALRPYSAAFRVQHIPSRGLHSVHSSALAIINEHQLEDTFCMVRRCSFTPR